MQPRIFLPSSPVSRFAIHSLVESQLSHSLLSTQAIRNPSCTMAPTTIRTGYAKIVTLARPYCRRCDRTFDSGRARDQHYEDSARHNICDVCRFDGSSCDELVQHHRSTRHRFICNGCGDGGWWIPDSQAYKDHLRDDNVCTICERHFDSLNNLRHVRITLFKHPALTLLQSSL